MATCKDHRHEIHHENQALTLQPLLSYNTCLATGIRLRLYQQDIVKYASKLVLDIFGVL